MNGHSDAVEAAIAEHIECEEQDAIDIQNFYGCIKPIPRRYFSDNIEDEYEQIKSAA